MDFTVLFHTKTKVAQGVFLLFFEVLGLIVFGGLDSYGAAQ